MKARMGVEELKRTIIACMFDVPSVTELAALLA